MKKPTLKDVAAAQMSPQAKKAVQRAIDASCKEQVKLLEKAKRKELKIGDEE